MNELALFKQYKKAKIIASDLEKAIKIMDETLKKLKPMYKYTAVMETFYFMDSNKILLEIQLASQKRTIRQYEEFKKKNED